MPVRHPKCLLATKDQSCIGRGLQSALFCARLQAMILSLPCTRSKQELHSISLQAGDLDETFRAMGAPQTTEEFRKCCVPRAGIESTFAEGPSGARRRGNSIWSRQ